MIKADELDGWSAALFARYPGRVWEHNWMPLKGVRYVTIRRSGHNIRLAYRGNKVVERKDMGISRRGKKKR